MVPMPVKPVEKLIHQGKWRIAVITAILVLGMQFMVASSQPPQLPLLESVCMTNPVTLDGAITRPTEWSEVSPRDLNLSATITARFWIKNDAAWLYILERVPWPSGDTDLGDLAQINYFWDGFSDMGIVTAGNATTDAYGFNGTTWFIDILASPPGQNNVQGAATHDGTHYWFEYRKALNSLDGRDWILLPGNTYGETPTIFLLGLRDTSKQESLIVQVRIYLSTCSVGGKVLETVGMQAWVIMLGVLGVIAAILFGTDVSHKSIKSLGEI